MVGKDRDQIHGLEYLRSKIHGSQGFLVNLYALNVRIGVMDRSALFIKASKYLQRRRFADVIGVALVSDAQRENLGAIDAFALRVQGVGDAPCDKRRHLAVDVSR